MSVQANSGTDRADGHMHIRARFVTWTILMLLTLMIGPAAATEDDVRAAFDRFVAAQNAHDVKAVEALLLASPNFLWITRGIPVWGMGRGTQTLCHAVRRHVAPRAWRFRLEDHHDRRLGRSDLCPNRLHDRRTRSAGAVDQVSIQSGAGQDAAWLEGVEHPAHPCACAIIWRGPWGRGRSYSPSLPRARGPANRNRRPGVVYAAPPKGVDNPRKYRRARPDAYRCHGANCETVAA